MLGGSFGACWAVWDGTAREEGDVTGAAPACGNSSKERTICDLPSSVTWKSCWLRPFTEWPLESVTTMSSTTTCVEVRKVIGGESASATSGAGAEAGREVEGEPEASGGGVAAATVAVDACTSRAPSSAASTDANVVSSGGVAEGSWETGASSPGTSALAATYLA